MASRTRRGKQGTHRWVTPLQYTSLQLWLPADQITGLADNDAVTTWPDRSGNARDASQATAAKKPLYKTAIVGGLPVVRFDGTDDTMSTVNILNAQTAIALYLVLVVRVAATRIILEQAPASQFSVETEATPQPRFFINNTADARTSSLTVGVATILSEDVTGGNITAYKDGVAGTTVAHTGNTGTAALYLASRADGSLWHQVDMAELAIFNVAHTDIRRRLERSLGRKYAIAA